jgi:ubiquinone/menaquinone biosynthesis C-methylase UbiE
MKTTDYSTIASKYDTNKKRNITTPDRILMEALEKIKTRPFHVLDLGCGTGIYLGFHTKYFKNDKIAWHGIDAAAAMLEKAREKTDKAELQQGDAHNLPYAPDSFHYVTCNFAFHHFLDKYRVLDEITRVLKPGGFVQLKNLEPFYARDWWVYTYFPVTWCEDLKRFWKTDLIEYELENRGFTVSTQIEVFRKPAMVSDILETAQQRDISELNIIPEHEYTKGLKRMESVIAEDPRAVIRSEFALIEITGVKIREP